MIKEKRDILERFTVLGEQCNKLQTQLDVVTQQNSDAYARIAAKYGTEDLEGSEIEELEQWLASLGTETNDWQADLHKVVQEIKVGGCFWLS